jgi:aryl-alcohol dehydrogenase-like predicted oxidoreductase
MTWGRETPEAEARRIYSLAREHGVVWFDTAALYSDGEAERILGRCLKDDPKRDEVHISTKVGYEGELVRDALGWSLLRLGVDQVEVCFHHHWMRHGADVALYDLFRVREEGRAAAIGLSNCAAWQVAYAHAKWPIDWIQILYNLVKRQAEVELLPMAEELDIGVMAYSPLASGLLTGKYGGGPPGVGRLDEDERYRRRYDGAARVDVFVSTCRANGYPPTAAALQWGATHPLHPMPIVGARTAAQLQETLQPVDR